MEGEENKDVVLDGTRIVDSIFKIVFGFLLGWLFAVYVVDRISPLGSISDWRYIAYDCLKTANAQDARLSQMKDSMTKGEAQVNIAINQEEVPLDKKKKKE